MKMEILLENINSHEMNEFISAIDQYNFGNGCEFNYDYMHDTIEVYNDDKFVIRLNKDDYSTLSELESEIEYRIGYDNGYYDNLFGSLICNLDDFYVKKVIDVIERKLESDVICSVSIKKQGDINILIIGYLCDGVVNYSENQLSGYFTLADVILKAESECEYYNNLYGEDEN